MTQHNVYQNGGGRDFIFFNDGDLTMEPIASDDLQAVKVDSKLLASFAWSSNINFYFILLDGGLMCVHAPTGTGLLCRKKSAKFIEAFIDAPYPKKGRR